MSGYERWGYGTPRPGPRKAHRARRSLYVLVGAVAAGAVIGWVMGR